MKTFFTVLFGNWKKILAISIITTVLTTILGVVYTTNKTVGTIFVNIGAVEKITTSNENNLYDTIQAADQFSETVQGWLKNPSLLETINRQSGYQANLTTRKQERQNFTITFKTQSEEAANKIITAIKNNMEQLISLYNTNNSSNFTLSLFTYTVKQSETTILIFLLSGLFAGIFIGYFFALYWNMLKREYALFRHEKR